MKTETQGEGHVTMEPETEMMHLQAREHQECWQQQQLEEAKRVLSWRLQREHGSADTLFSDFWPPEL